jgi:DNA invertase Pin-like site-specific DNA recombinase
MPVIGGIIRVSTKAQAGTDSPENQRETLARAGATVFYEEAVSGSAKGGQRRRQSPSWQQLTADIASGRLTKLLVCDVSRIARRDALITELVELCDQHGVEFLANSGGTLTAKTAAQWLSVKQQGIFAEYFARELSDKIKRGQAAAIARGVFGFTSAHLPWHLQKDPADPRKVIARPECWEDARRELMAYIEGQITTSELCRRIHAKHGIFARTAAAHKWLRSGWLRGHYAKRGTGEVLIANIAPALISEAEHELLLLRLTANRKEPGKRSPHRVYALSGLCFCSACGGALNYNVAGHNRYLRCGVTTCANGPSRVRADLIEFDIRAAMGLRVDDVAAAERRRRQVSKPSKELLNLRQRIKKLEEVLALADSPGVRADHREAVARLQQLEAVETAPLSEPTLWEMVRAGSENWWEERDEGQRQTCYMTVLRRAVVDTRGKVLVSCEWL